MKTGTHTSHEFESELRELRGNLLAMSARCERAVQEAVAAFMARDLEKAAAVRDLDERIDRDEMEIDDLALRVLALRQPVAYDLRFLTTTLKFVTDLERIGDEAVNIAERVEEFARASMVPPHAEIAQMAQIAQSMLREALDAFVEGDSVRAEKVLARDDEVDQLYGTVLRNVFTWMREHPVEIPTGQAVASVAKYLERVADHATNLAEYVVFMVRGDDVRHRSRTAGQPPTKEKVS
jgi:phosphate transport system protein